MRKSLLRMLAALVLASCSGAVAAEKPPVVSSPKPNIILILVDDLGWMDLSCQGSDYYRTPAIDGMATEGIRFTDAYAACAVCSPTRAAVQTGRYPHRIGLTNYIHARLHSVPRCPVKTNRTEYVGGRNQKLLCPPNPYWMEHKEITIAEALNDAGYQNGYVGKWHLGDPDWYPEAQGYDVNRGGCFYGQPPSYFDPYNNPKSAHECIREGIHGLPGRKPGEYLTHREADEATALIRGWHARKQPFFLQVSHYAVHYRYGSPPYSIIRKGDWKLIKFRNGSRELYDLSTDPGEEKDLAADKEDQAAELETTLMRRLEDDGAKLPRANPGYVPKENPASRREGPPVRVGPGRDR